MDAAFFDLSESNPIENRYSAIEDALRNRYSTGLHARGCFEERPTLQDQADREESAV